VNTGSAIEHQSFLPGLTVHATKTAATVLDDGVGVAGATLKGGGHTVKTNASGKAPLAAFNRRTAIAVSAAGYANTAFRKP